MNRVPKPDRESADIIHDLLALTKQGPQMKTWLMYKANLNSKQIGDYIDILLRYRLIILGKEKYHITEKGHIYLLTYGKLKGLLK